MDILFTVQQEDTNESFSVSTEDSQNIGFSIDEENISFTVEGEAELWFSLMQEEEIQINMTSMYPEKDPIFCASPAFSITDQYIQNWIDAYNKRHTHPNKDLIDSLINSGLGNKYLADDWTYKSVSWNPFDFLQLKTDLTPVASQPWLIQWNTVDGTIDVGLINGSILQVGQETMFYGKAQGAILNGDNVQFAWVQWDHILMKRAVASEIEANPHFFIGVATNNIANGSMWYATWFGKINGVYTKTPANNDTQDWIAWDILYMNMITGYLTKTKPTVPKRNIIVCAVIKEQTGASESGVLMVRPSIGIKLEDLDDVNGTEPVEWSIMTYKGTYWDADKNINDYAELAIETTQDNLYTNLIPNNLLIAWRQYLVSIGSEYYRIQATSTNTYIRIWLSWLDLATKWTVEPVSYNIQPTYEVLEYTYWTTKYYRRVYNTYNPATDIFYAEPWLTTVVASRALSLT